MFSDTEKLSEEKGENVNDEGDKPFEFIKRFAPEHLLNFIQQEHPQVIALVLAHLEPYKASIILQNLYQELQSDVARRIATLDHVSPTIIREIERVLEKKLSMLSSETYSEAGGVESTVEILNLLGHDSREHIIKAFENEEPELAMELKRRLNTSGKPCRKI
jgi:flagellar motor switch protein FliG